MAKRSIRFARATVALVVLAAACEEKPAPKPESSAEKDGGARDLPPGVDRNLAEAVRAVAGGQGSSPSGPPPTGVFAKGAADKEFRPDEPPKLTLGARGTAPTVRFAATPMKPGKRRETTVEVAVQTGANSALPTVDVTFTLEASVGDAPLAAPSAAPPGSPLLEVVATISRAKLAPDQPGRLPPELEAEIAKIRGSKARFLVSPNGAGRAAGFQGAAGADDGVVQIARSASEILAVQMLPFPEEPVGVGAYWMVGSRETALGLDVLSYRMIKVEKIEGDRATLSVNTRRYVAGGQIGLAGLPPHEILEFSGNTTGQILVPAQDPFALRGQFADVLMANLQPKGGGGPPGQRLGLQLQVRSVIEGK